MSLRNKKKHSKEEQQSTTNRYKILKRDLVKWEEQREQRSLAGKKRFITENSYMLIHEIRSGTWGKFSHMCESVENSKQLMEHIKSYYVKLTQIKLQIRLFNEINIKIKN